MNYQLESKADGPQRITSHMTKTFCDTLSDSLPKSSKMRKSTRFQFKTDSHHNPIRTKGPNPTRNQLLQSLQKENHSPQIRKRGSNYRKTKNYRFSRASRSRKTTSIRKFTAIITKFSWLLFQTLQNKKVIRQH